MTSFIDNRDGNTMAQALRQVFGDVKVTGMHEGDSDYAEITSPEEVRIASAYFSPSGFQHIATSLEKVGKVRLMLGADLPIEAYFKPKKPGQTSEKQHQDMLKDRLKVLQTGLETERNYLPFNAATAQSMGSLINALKNGNMEVRRYEKNFLHAKAYIFTEREDGGLGKNGLLAGSSNLTSAGLTRNLELNIGRNDQQTVEKAIEWFDELWEDAVPLDLVELYEEQFEPQEPWLIFLRVLLQLYGDELEEEVLTGTSKMLLTTFQEHGVERTLRLLNENGGAIVADEVGLGKTFIAGRIIKEYIDRGQRALLICPAALRDSTWKTFLSDFQMFCECVSYHELANDRQLNIDGDQDVLARLKDEYQLIIVDEAHNYRNPDTQARAQILRTLLFGRRKEVLMLTATPVNNSLWDLHTLLDYFIRQDGMFTDKGILSMRQRFKDAARLDPADLSPDMLYPIIDATTVKRTRQFVKKHYAGDEIMIGGQKQKINFPEPKPITVRYDLDAGSPGLMEAVFEALDPDTGSLTFARYGVGRYQTTQDEDETASSMAAVGLLRSGLLKRFESSSAAFRITLSRIRQQYATCLDMLEKGFVVTTKFHNEFSADDETGIEELLEDSESALPVEQFDKEQIKADLLNDVAILDDLISRTEDISHSDDAKLLALRAELEKIVEEAEAEASDRIEEIDKRKVLIFSFFADSADWIYDWLTQEVNSNPNLTALKGRIGKVAGGFAKAAEEESKRDDVVLGFAPVSMGKPERDNLFDILVTTDVLAEGVNLQQCRHIINYDLPWNPMRLVQRHGRIDRIGSKHSRVFLRSIFPDEQLDELLSLEQRILDKIALAAATVGVQGPVEGAAGGSQVFTETREELEKIITEDASFYERGGSPSAAQSGEEYRQTLRKALDTHEKEIKRLPWRAGSGMVKGKERGVFFSAYIDDKPQLCFVRADEAWHPIEGGNAIEAELGACLRIIEAEPNTEIKMPITEDQAYEFWAQAEAFFYEAWQFKTDPINLQPKVRKLNRDVIEFLETNPIGEISEERLQRAVKILESVWGRRDEAKLRVIFLADYPSKKAKIEELVDWITDGSGLIPIEPPLPLEPIEKEDIKLLCWMAVEAINSEPR
jgi:superfamily II DNA or RNA helicase